VTQTESILIVLIFTGPMVYAAFCCIADNLDTATKNGEERPATALDRIPKLNDSKVLSEEMRNEIFSNFSEDKYAFAMKIISPSQISKKCFRRQKSSLNEISHDAAIELIEGLHEQGVKIAKVYVDTVGPIDKYQVSVCSIYISLG